MIATLDGGKTWIVRVVAGADKLDFRGIRAFDADSDGRAKGIVVDRGKQGGGWPQGIRG